MKKLILDLDALEVESFRTADPQPARGTVIGAASTETLPLYCVTFTCGDSEVRPCRAD
ncbi:MAG: hypothetical protein KY467_10885 [Gemmatimonadetes bacterium]|nr:hypothetical protein [Gemmatimonadota bacterium]